jgi:hypothetical protein
MNWELKIEKCINGFTAEWWEDGEPEDIRHRMLFEAQDTETGEMEAFTSLVYFLQDHFGLSGSKHDHYRVKCAVVDQREGEDGKDI